MKTHSVDDGVAARVGVPAPGDQRQRGQVGGRLRTRSADRIREAGFGYLLLAPQVIGFLVLALYPLVEVFRLSLHSVNGLTGIEEFIGFDNFDRMFADSNFGRIMVNTVFMVVVLSVLETVLGLGLALLVNQKLPGISFFRAAIFIPALVTMVAWTIVWRFILQPDGLLDWFSSLFGMASVDWLRSDFLTLAILAIVQTLKNVGLYMMIYLAALQGVDQELVEAARVDGAGRWRTFRSIVMPQISPSILMVFMLAMVGAFKIFDVIYILTQGGPGVDTTVLSYAVYDSFAKNDIGYASAYSVILFLVVIVISASLWGARRRFVFYEDK